MKMISLFSGAMGLDLGLEKAGFKTATCVENDPKAVETIKLNKPKLHVFDCSISEVSGNSLKEAAGFRENDEVPLIVGGPPCQSFSVFGKRRGIKDKRGQLIFEYIRIINEIKPSIFIMENVRGLLSMSILPKTADLKKEKENKKYYEHGSLIKLILKEFNKIGYRVDCFVVNAVNYGAPQIRERVILIGNKYNLEANFPEPTHSNRPSDKLISFKTLDDVIGLNSDFIDPCPEVLDFSPRKLNYLSMVPPGGNWRSLPVELQKESMGKTWYLKGGRSAYWRKLSFSFPSPTVVTMPNHAGTSMCHPTELRAITVGEAAAIQEFPKNWKFSGSVSDKFRQIGNAVPIKLGEVAGKVVKDLLSRINRERNNSELLIPNKVVHIRPHVRTRTFWKNGSAFAGNYSYYEEENQMYLEFNSIH